MIHAINLFANVFKILDGVDNNMNVDNIDCNMENPSKWEHGLSIIKAIKSIEDKV